MEKILIKNITQLGVLGSKGQGAISNILGKSPIEIIKQDDLQIIGIKSTFLKDSTFDADVNSLKIKQGLFIKDTTNELVSAKFVFENNEVKVTEITGTNLAPVSDNAIATMKVVRDLINNITGKIYTGVSPIYVDNDNNSISLDINVVNKINEIDTIKTQVETNKQNIINDILPNLQENTVKLQELESKDIELSTNITSNAQKIEQIKSLDNLVCGDNLYQQPQGDKEVFINTSDNLTVNSLSARNGVIEMKDETHFKNTPHIEQAMVIDNTNLKVASTIEMLDNDLKIVNSNGDALIRTKKQLISLDDLKTKQDGIISELATKVLLNDKGEWNSQTTYKEFDLVRHNGDKYWLDKETSINEEPTPQNKFWVDFTPNVADGDFLTRPEAQVKFDAIDLEIKDNLNSIDDLKLKHQLNQQLINKIGINHNLTIDSNQSANWELSLIFSELDPSDISKGTIQMVPSSLKEYQLKHILQTFSDNFKSINAALKNITTSTNKVIVPQLFQGAESKGSENNIGESFYGYNPREFTTPIPLKKEVGIATFGNIFDVNYQEWEGVLFNGEKIPFGTKNDRLGIDLTNDSFKATMSIKNIELYKEVVNDGITESEVNAKLATKIDKFNVTTNETLTGWMYDGKPVYAKIISETMRGDQVKVLMENVKLVDYSCFTNIASGSSYTHKMPIRESRLSDDKQYIIEMYFGIEWMSQERRIYLVGRALKEQFTWFVNGIIYYIKY